MANFIKSSLMINCLEDILEEAKSEIILISPEIKLQEWIRDALLKKSGEPRVKITVVFGGTTGEINESIAKEDFKMLAEFPNVEIRHEPRLHCRYYANENKALLSSMDLQDFQLNNNIEIGILVNQSLIGGLTGHTLDAEAWNYFQNAIENSNLVYLRTPTFEEKMMGLNKKYIDSNTEIDTLSKLLRVRISKKPRSEDEDSDKK